MKTHYYLFYVNVRGFRVFLTESGAWISEMRIHWKNAKRYVRYDKAIEKQIQLNQRPHCELVSAIAM